MKKYLIIGNGAAGTTAAEHIRMEDDKGEITVVTQETLPFYSRIRLPDYIAGKVDREKLVIKSPRWYEKNGIRLLTDLKINGLDLALKRAKTAQGKLLDFDSLLIATGSVPFIPPVKGSDKEGVSALRTVDDALKLKQLDPKAQKVVVIGGGLLGLETASALIDAGRNITIVEFFDRLLPRQLDYEGARRLQLLLENRGMKFRLGVKTREIRDEHMASSSPPPPPPAAAAADKTVFPLKRVELDTGETIDAHVIIFSAGVRPDLSLIENPDIKTDRGIVVTQRMETSTPGVYAAGDVAEFQGINFCIWQEAAEQGRVAGINMAGGDAFYKNTPPSTILKVAGISLASAGDIDVEGKMEQEVVSSDSIYKKIVRDNNGNIIGCIMLGDTSDFKKMTKIIKGAA
ncbi:MAG: NAD(P)/FAD-dependent oxidoreductase [Desulfamplus sp.]|nr:NAD(P)/FAD-dependent oxidoreductase [Desulfamplus sp.]